jgi:hypothetical protein
MVVGVALAVVLTLSWAVITVLRRGRQSEAAVGTAQTRDALRQFADQSLVMQSVPEILAFAREAAQVIFGCDRVVAFEKGAEEGQWEASIPGVEGLGEVPAAIRGLFGWFRHNSAIASENELGEARFGAMRGPLRQLMERFGIDVAMPLVSETQIIAMVGMRLGRKPVAMDRELMKLFRLQATAACANVRLHAEAAHMVSLAKEVDLASAVKLALVPDEMEGAVGAVRWAGYYQAVGDAGSDFWGAYPLSDGRVMLLIGDAIGAGLAGSLVSAVVKSCADAIFDARPQRLGPAQLLGAMNRALYRSRNPVHTSCFAVLIDASAGTVEYANAGHTIPYHLKADGSLSVLKGAGPLLGDEATASYPATEIEITAGDGLVFYTDGLIKATDGEGKSYGERRLQKQLKGATGNAALLRTQILGSIDEFRGPSPYADDAALLVVRVG